MNFSFLVPNQVNWLMWALLKQKVYIQDAYEAYVERTIRMDITFFEMREILKTFGLCYAYRRSSEDEALVIFYEPETNMLIATDWIENKPYLATIDDIEATDWCVTRFLL